MRLYIRREDQVDWKSTWFFVYIGINSDGSAWFLICTSLISQQFGPRPEVPSDAVILRYLSDLSLWAAHREGCTEENMASIEALTKAFKRLEVDGKKQKTLIEMGFKPK